ncbi:MAG: nucleotide exchange factor GrpE [Hyphomicrobiaceae bacterium]|nr:nucleotide exchange factor GrpE [Hyphomicrobiaceae bacterium]
MSNEHKAEDVANGATGQSPASPNGKPERPAAQEAAREAAPGAGTGSGEQPTRGADPLSAAEARVDAMLIEVETLKGQIADLTGRLLRAHADMDNLRKRGEREKQETARYAISKFARDTVEVADNFARALTAVPAAAIEQNEQLKALLEGVSMTERAFIGVLERHGVKQVAPNREPFNPHLHQAVMERPDSSVPTGTVLECFQPGYIIEDRCLRPAVVVVSTGGPKAAKAPAGDKPAQNAETKAESVGEAETAAEPGDGNDATPGSGGPRSTEGSAGSGA